MNRIPRSPEPCFPSWQDLRKYELEKEVEGLATLSRGYLATISALEAQLKQVRECCGGEVTQARGWSRVVVYSLYSQQELVSRAS